MPRCGDGWLKHYRLSLATGLGEALPEILFRGVTTLIVVGDVGAAIEQAVGYPTPLPSVLVEAFDRLLSVEQRSLVKRPIESSGSSLSRLFIDTPAERRENWLVGRASSRQPVRLVVGR